LAVFSGQNFKQYYGEHITRCVLCATVALEEVSNQKYNVSLPCGEYFPEFPRSKCEAHLEKCDVCREFSQTSLFPMSFKEKAFMSFKEKAFINHKILTTQQDVKDGWKSLLKTVDSFQEFRFYVADNQHLEDKLSRLKRKLDETGIQTNQLLSQTKLFEAQKNKQAMWNEVLPLYLVDDFGSQNMTFFFNVNGSNICIEEKLTCDDPTFVGSVIPEGHAIEFPCFLETVSNKMVSLSSYDVDSLTGTKLISVSWRFQQHDSPGNFEKDGGVTFMAFEVEPVIWRVFTLCVEKFLTKYTQDVAQQHLLRLLSGSVTNVVTSYLECTSALHVLLYIIHLFEPLRCEKDAVFDPITYPNIRILIPRVIDRSVCDSFFYKRLDPQFDNSLLQNAQKTHHKKCNDFMLQFIADHAF
jgi:hypothetical protein